MLLASSAVEYRITRSVTVRTCEDTSMIVLGRIVAGSTTVPHRYSYAVASRSFGIDVNRMGLTLTRRGAQSLFFPIIGQFVCSSLKREANAYSE